MKLAIFYRPFWYLYKKTTLKLIIYFFYALTFYSLTLYALFVLFNS